MLTVLQVLLISTSLDPVLHVQHSAAEQPRLRVCLLFEFCVCSMETADVSTAAAEECVATSAAACTLPGTRSARVGCSEIGLSDAADQVLQYWSELSHLVHTCDN